jgi:hypothetical protein
MLGSVQSKKVPIVSAMLAVRIETQIAFAAVNFIGATNQLYINSADDSVIICVMLHRLCFITRWLMNGDQ